MADDNMKRLEESAEAAYRYYNLILKDQDEINRLIKKGTIKSFEDLSKKVAKVANDDLVNVKHNIVEASRELEKMSDSFSTISDNLLSNRVKLQKFLGDIKNYNDLKTESYKLQRQSLKSDNLSLNQMKKALSVMGRQLRVRTRSEKLSERELSNKEFLLKTLKNAGDLSPKGLQLIDDAVFGKINRVNESLIKTKSLLIKNAEQTDYHSKRVSELTSEFRKFQNLTMRQGKLKKESKTLAKQAKKASKSSDLNPKTISARQKAIGKQMKEISKEMSGMTYSSFKEYLNSIEQAESKLLELAKSKGKILERSKKLKDVLEKLKSSTLSGIDKKLLDQLNLYKKLYDEGTSIEEKSGLLIKKMQGATEINKDQISFYRQMLGLLDAQQQATGEVGDVEYRMYKRRAGFLVKADKIHDDIQEKIQEQFTTMSDIASFVPFIGDNLSTNIDNARQKVSDLASEMYQEFALTFSKTGSASKALGNAMSKALSKPGAVAAMAIGAAVVAAGALYIQIRKLSLLMEEVSSETGLTASQAFLLEKAALKTQIRFDNVLSSMKDIRDAQKGIVNEAGFFLQVNTDVLNTVSNVGRAYGYGSEMAGKLQTELMQVTGGSEILAANTQVAMASIAEAEGLAPGLIPQDIVENSELVARYFTGYPGNLAKSVIEIHKMGLGLRQMGDMMQHLLDYEKSITAEFEASVAIGRHVNVGRARDLLLQENVLGAMEQMRKEAGSLAEFEQLGFARRQLMANAMGLSVKETRKMLFVSEKLTGESDALKESTLENYELIQKLSGGNESLFKVQAKNIQASQQFETALMKIKNVFKRALLPLLESMLPLLKMAANLISVVAKVVDGLLAPMNVMLGLLNDTARAIGAAFGEGDGRGAFASTKEAAGNFLPSVKEDGDYLGAGGKLAGLVGAGYLGFKGIQRMRGKGGGGKSGGGLLSKIPLIGKGRGSSPSKPMFVSVVGGNMSSFLGGRKKRAVGKGRVAKSDVLARYKRMKGKSAGGRLGKSIRGARGLIGKGIGKIGGLASGIGGAVASSKVGKGIGKIGGKGLAKLGGKSLLTKIPGVSILAGLGFGAQSIAKGDLLGGAGELLSGVAGTFPGIGTAVSMAIDAGLAGRDAGMFKGGGIGKSIGGALLGGPGMAVSGISRLMNSGKSRPESKETSEYIKKEEYINMNKQLIGAINSVREEISRMRESPSLAIIEDSTAKELNKKIRGYNGS